MKRFALGSPERLTTVLLWAAPLLIIAGLSAGLVTNRWNWLPLGLLALGGSALLLWLIQQSRVSTGFWGRRSTQTSTNAILTVIAVIALLGIINFLADRYSVEIDLTENRAFTLAAETRDVLQTLDQPVRVLVFDANAASRDRLLLEQYRRQANSQFSFEFIDPQEQPALAKKYNVTQVGQVIVVAGKKTQRIDEDLSESNLTPALIRVTSDRTIRAYFTTGHNELPLAGGAASLSEVAKLLEQRDIELLPLNLLEKGKIPEDANVIVVAGPRQPFLRLEQDLLKAYLNRGGSLLLMLDVDVNAGLDDLLNNWGLTLDNRWVIDGSGVGQQVGLGPDTIVVTTYGNHPITQRFAQGPSVFPRAQAIRIDPVKDDDIVEIVLSGPQTWAETDWESGNLEFTEGVDTKGPLPIGVAITRQLSNNPPKEARLVVFGDSEFATDGVIAYQGINSDLFVNSVLWLGDRDQKALSIRPRETTNRRLQLNVTTSRWLEIISVFLLPLVGFGAAVFVWWRRR